MLNSSSAITSSQSLVDRMGQGLTSFDVDLLGLLLGLLLDERNHLLPSQPPVNCHD